MIKRFITAAVLLGIFIPLFYIGGPAVYLMVGAVGILAFYELTDLANLPVILRWLTIVLFEVMLFMDTRYLAFGFFTIILILMICAIWDERVKVDDVFMLSCMGMFICFSAHAFLILGLRNNFYMYGLAIITYINDTGAYFAGNFIGNKMNKGKHKFNPRVSPHKTWEGAIGGFVASVVFSVLIHFIWPELFMTTGNALIIGIVLGVSGQMGDLLFSLIKRHFGIKDYGNLLPGHGGALDRIDSLLTNFAVALVLLEILL